MMELWVRLGDEDWAKYGGAEWLPLDVTAYDDMPLSDQAALERQLPVSLFRLFAGGEIARQTAIGRTSAAWLARQQAGLTEPAFAEFAIRQMEIRSRMTPGGTAPLGVDRPAPGEPEPGSSSPSPATAPSRKRSR